MDDPESMVEQLDAGASPLQVETTLWVMQIVGVRARAKELLRSEHPVVVLRALKVLEGASEDDEIDAEFVEELTKLQPTEFVMEY